MSLKKIIDLMKAKYPDSVLLIYNDESGRIVTSTQAIDPYSHIALFDFHDIKELISHLKAKA